MVGVLLLIQNTKQEELDLSKYIQKFTDFDNKLSSAIDFYIKESVKISGTQEQSIENWIRGKYKKKNKSNLADFRAIRKLLAEDTSFLKNLDESHQSYLKGIIKDLSEYIETNKIKESIVLYRNIDISKITELSSLKVGEVFGDTSFSACSLIPLRNFGDTTLKILTKSNSNVANIKNGDGFEYLAQKGSKFKILEKNNNEIVVELL